MREMATAKMNAMRSGVVVIGTLAFGYLSLQLGFKPFLEKAQQQQQQQQQLHQSHPSPNDPQLQFQSISDRPSM